MKGWQESYINMNIEGPVRIVTKGGVMFQGVLDDVGDTFVILALKFGDEHHWVVVDTNEIAAFAWLSGVE